jgi:hypothetical protein
MKASLTQPALIGGLVGGVLSALPLIAAGNLCCCLWIVSGGAVAAYVLQQNQSLPIAPGDGALVGLLAGVIGAFVYVVLSIPINFLVAPMDRVLLQRLGETMGNMPPEFRQYAAASMSAGVRMVLGFVLMLVLGAIFSTIGGWLGALVFRKKMPPGVIDLPAPG